MRSRRILIAALLTAGAVATPPAGGQSGPPPCSAAVADQPTIDAVDLDVAQSSTLVATHSLRVSVDFFAPAAAVDDGSVTVSAAGGTGPSSLTFFSDAAGPLPVDIAWTQDDGSGRATCSATASTTLQLDAPTPIPRLTNRLTHQRIDLKYTLGWSFAAFLGPTADHRPVVLSYRGVRRSRLPGPSVPFTTITAPLRSGDHGYRGTERNIVLPRMSLRFTAATDVVGLRLDSRISTHHSQPVAYDIQLTQADRLLARFRLAGTCSAFSCNMRTVKVQR